MSALTKPRFSRLEFIVLGVLGLMLAWLFMASVGRMGESSVISKCIANCRQVTLSLRLYAADHHGAYPDSKLPFAKDSNTVFRQLMVAGTLEDEKIFGCFVSPFTPDGDIGSKPDFLRAVEINENHWAMTKGLTDASPEGIPLVYENPAAPTWPPTWNADARHEPYKGRVWSGGKVIIGTNDTSAQLYKLTSAKGSNVTVKPYRDEKNVFEAHRRPDGTGYDVLDVAWDGTGAVAPTYHPVLIWTPVVLFGVLSGLLLYLVKRRQRARTTLTAIEPT